MIFLTIMTFCTPGQAENEFYHLALRVASILHCDISSPEYGFQHLKHLILCFVPHSGTRVDPRGRVRALDRAFLRGACVLLREREVFTRQVLLALFDIIKAHLWKVVYFNISNSSSHLSHAIPPSVHHKALVDEESVVPRSSKDLLRGGKARTLRGGK